jgi:DNA replication ATP-dependent helicase Dna2
LLANKFIMIGDYHQLNPLIKSKLAGKKGMSTSLFERICKSHPDCTTVLKKQFRMNKEILELSNSTFYKGVMQVGDQRVANQKVEFPTNVK